MNIYPEEEIVQMLNDLVDRESKLNDFERNVVSTCLDMSDKHIPITDKQRAVIDEAWERVT